MSLVSSGGKEEILQVTANISGTFDGIQCSTSLEAQLTIQLETIYQKQTELLSVID